MTQDLFETDFSAADVVTLYLLPDVNSAPCAKAVRDAQARTRIVSHDYGLGDRPADVTLEVDAPGKTVGVAKRSTLLLWTVPPRRMQ